MALSFPFRALSWPAGAFLARLFCVVSSPIPVRFLWSACERSEPAGTLAALQCARCATSRHIGGTLVRNGARLSAHFWQHSGASSRGIQVRALVRVPSLDGGTAVRAGGGRSVGAWTPVPSFSLASFALCLVLRGRTFGRCVLGYGRECATVLPLSLSGGLRLADAFPCFQLLGFVQFSSSFSAAPLPSSNWISSAILACRFAHRVKTYAHWFCAGRHRVQWWAAALVGQLALRSARGVA